MSTQRRAVRARAAHDPRRRQLAGARLPLGRRHAALLRARRGRRTSGTPTASATSTTSGSWGPAILGHAHPDGRRARCARRRRTGCRSARRPSSRSRWPRRSCARAAVARAGAARVVGHRGDDVGAAPRARLHRPREDRQVRGLLPRPRRQPAREGGLGRAHVRPAALGRRAAGDRRATRSCSPYNDLAAARGRVSRATATRSPRVIVEPIAGNMNLVVPRASSSQALRALCTRHGAVLIFDEVMTGFRVGAAGRAGAATASRPTSRRSAR